MPHKPCCLPKRTQHSDVDLQDKGFRCILEIVHAQYHFMAPYMRVLFGITLQAMESPTEKVALHAIEFWVRNNKPVKCCAVCPFWIPKLTRCCDCCWNINARIFSHFLRYGTFAHTTVAIPVQPLFLLLSFPCHTLVLLVPTVRYWIRLGEGRVSSNENINAVRSWCSKLSYP